MVMEPSTEQHLIEAVKTGDRGALGRLLSEYHYRIYNVVLRMVRHRDDAAEVTQEVMLKIVEHIDEFQGRSHITTWMIRIAMNLAISHLRQGRVRAALSLNGMGTDQGSSGGNVDRHRSLVSHIPDHRELRPDLGVEQKESIALLHRALAKIDIDFKAVLVLRDIDQMDYQQVAEVLDVPVGTVKSRLFRARLALRQQMIRLT